MKKGILSVLLLALVLWVGGCSLTLDDGGSSSYSGDDSYEPNDYMSSAYSISETTTYTAVQGDDDWYEIDVTSGYLDVEVDVDFTDSEGDIDVKLYSSGGTLLASSTSYTDDELINYTVSSSGTYYIKVYGDDAGNTYTIWWDDTSSTPSVTDDSYEPNDYMSSAASISEGSTHNLILADSADWFEIDVTPGFERLDIDVNFTDSDGDIDIKLYNGSGTVIASSLSTSDDESISGTVTSSGTYYLKVYHAGTAPSSQNYTLWWDDTAP